MRHRMLITVVGTFGALAVLKGVTAQPASPPASQPALQTASPPARPTPPQAWLADLGSGSAVAQARALNDVLRLGPAHIETVRRAADELNRVVEMHRRLMVTSSAPDDLDSRSRSSGAEVEEAVRFFAARGAVEYLLEGFASSNLLVHREIAQALWELDEETRRPFQDDIMRAAHRGLKYGFPWRRQPGTEINTVRSAMMGYLVMILRRGLGQELLSQSPLDDANLSAIDAALRDAEQRFGPAFFPTPR